MPEQPPDYDKNRTPEELFDRLHRLADRLGELVTPDNIDTANIPTDANVSYHYGYIKNAEGEIEYTKPLPSVRPGKKGLEAFPPATPANINPSRAKAPKRPYKLLYVFSDAQIDYRRTDTELTPIHDEKALRVGRMLCRDLQPEVIVNLGDTVDLAALSRFKPDSDHFSRTLGPSFQRVHDYYAELRADNPRARIVEVDSNHNTRLKDFVLKNMPQLYGIKQAGASEEDYPVMSYAYLANLKAVGVEWISGYGAARFQYAPDLELIHGTMVASNSSTAAKLSKANPEINIIQGHAHRMERHTRTNRAGQYLSAIVVGAACRTTGEVPSYHSAVDDRNQVVKYQEDWQQGVLVIRDYGDGHYQFDEVPIINGRAFYDGKEYKA